MSITTLFILIPFALLASSLICYLFFSKHDLLLVIRINILRIIAKVILYSTVIFILSCVLTFIGFMLLIGIVGLPVLLVIDIVLIILVIIKNIKNKKEANKIKGIKEIKSNIIKSMKEYLIENKNCGYSKKELRNVKRLLNYYSYRASKIRNKNKDRFNKLVEWIVVKLNSLNTKCQYSLIETDQRELICAYIVQIAIHYHFIDEYSDITEEWREW